MYHVVMSSKKMKDARHNTSVCFDSEQERFEDAVALSELLATTHTRDIVVQEPKRGSKGEYWFFTPNYTYITYFVKQVKQSCKTTT